ncbi:MAG: hypothetical protein ACU0DI_08165 [Paracoccaceae bacterium]
MSPRIPLSSISLVAFSSLAVFVFAAEFKSFDRTHLSSSDTPGVTVTVIPTRPLSLPAFHDALMSCDRAMSVPLAALQPEIARAATADACSELSRRAIALMPTYGFAHFVAAQAAFHRNEQRAAQFHLEKSVEFARFEGWLVERRLALVVFQMPGDALLASPTVKSDIATLLTTQSGAELLARYFLRRPVSRTIISEVAATADENDQTRLLNILKKLRATK